MNANTIKSLASILGITIITSIALLMGLDGLIFFAGASALSGLGGFYLAKRKQPPSSTPPSL